MLTRYELETYLSILTGILGGYCEESKKEAERKIIAEFDRLTEGNKKLEAEADQLSDELFLRLNEIVNLKPKAEALKRICEPAENWEEELRRNCYPKVGLMPYETQACHIIQRVCDYLDSQQKPNELPSSWNIKSQAAMDYVQGYEKPPTVTKYVCSQCGAEVNPYTWLRFPHTCKPNAGPSQKPEMEECFYCKGTGIKPMLIPCEEHKG